jgi:hypothetical protein
MSHPGPCFFVIFVICDFSGTFEVCQKLLYSNLIEGEIQIHSIKIETFLNSKCALLKI